MGNNSIIQRSISVSGLGPLREFVLAKADKSLSKKLMKGGSVCVPETVPHHRLGPKSASRSRPPYYVRPVLDAEVCYRALQTRDERFDGRLFVGVTSTGIYCRPVCPARAPKLENCRFFPSAAAAQQDGFRPCLRCRPEKAPELGPWRGTSNTVSRGLALIAAGELDGEVSVDDLAE